MEAIPKRCFPITLSGILGKTRPTNQGTPSTNENKKEELFVENGSKLLEELISTCNGKCNPIRSFSAQEILKATNNFKSRYYSNFDFDWYVGVLDNERQVLIKKFKNKPYVTTYEKPYTGPYRDIVISSLMSNHNNALKLLGSCLELPIPMLVYEYAEIGPLNSQGGVGFDGSSSSLSWEMRLKVAKDIANALAYLHTAFPSPIIHMNIFPENVFLDKGCVAKLSNFYCAVSIPKGETFVGTISVRACHPVFFDPCSIIEGNVEEESDVYSFGLFLLVLLTGRNAYFRPGEKPICKYVKDLVKEGWLIIEIADPEILEDGGQICEMKQQQLQGFLNLALRCIEFKREDRPSMVQVSKELRRFDQSM